MNCKDFEKQIPLFHEEMLSAKELKEFMAHIGECAECQEELAIHYLINEGIMRLEDGNAFDLQHLMASHMAKATALLKKRRMIQMAVYGFEVLLVLTIIVIMAIMFFSG